MRTRMRAYKFQIRFKGEDIPSAVREHVGAYGELYNNEIEVVRMSREKYRAERRVYCPAYAVPEARRMEIERFIEEAYAAHRKKQQGERAIVPIELKDDLEIKRLMAEKKECEALMKSLDAELKKDAGWTMIKVRLEGEKREALKRVERARRCNPYTASMIKKSVEQANKGPVDPFFKKFRGEGRIGIQFHAFPLTDEAQAVFSVLKVKKTAKEIGPEAYEVAVAELPRERVWRVADLFDRKNPKLRIERPSPGPCSDVGCKRKNGWGRRCVVQGEISFDKAVGWVGFTLQPHRLSVPSGERSESQLRLLAGRLHLLMDDENELKEAYISRRRVGRSYENFLCVVVKENASFPTKATGKIAVFPTWKRAGDGRVEVARLYDGERLTSWHLPKHERRLTKPKQDGSTMVVVDPLDMMLHSENIRELESLECNSTVPPMVDWIDEHAGECPPWLVEERSKIKKIGILKWSKPVRFVALMSTWRKNRFSGDEKIFEFLTAHVKHMIHLYEWWSSEQRRAIGWRNACYQKLAHELMTLGRYGTLVVADTELARKARRSRVKGEESVPDPIQALRFKVAPYMLVQSLKAAASNAGVEFVRSKVKVGKDGPDAVLQSLYGRRAEEKAA